MATIDQARSRYIDKKVNEALDEQKRQFEEERRKRAEEAQVAAVNDEIVETMMNLSAPARKLISIAEHVNQTMQSITDLRDTDMTIDDAKSILDLLGFLKNDLKAVFDAADAMMSEDVLNALESLSADDEGDAGLDDEPEYLDDLEGPSDESDEAAVFAGVRNLMHAFFPNGIPAQG